jgi:transposase
MIHKFKLSPRKAQSLKKIINESTRHAPKRVSSLNELKRFRAVLDIHEGLSMRQAAAKHKTSLSNLYRWWGAVARQPFLVGIYPTCGRPEKLSVANRACYYLERAVRLGPRAFKLKQSAWTLASLARYLEGKLFEKVSISTVRRALHRWKFEWR